MRHLNIDQLECEADRLLRKAGVLGHRAGQGIYTEQQIDWHRERHEVNIGDGNPMAQAVVEADMAGLSMMDLIELGDQAGLRDGERYVWNLSVLGMSTRDIAGTLEGVNRISQAGVQKRFVAARKKVHEYLQTYPYLGMWEVYWELVHRVCKARPCRHEGKRLRKV